MNRVRRIVVTVVIGVVTVMAWTTPAAAHSVAGTGATNYKTTLRRVEGTIPGLRVRVIEAGSRLEVSYDGTRTVYVLGYVEDRYLRIDRRGVFENLNSPATYINKTRQGVDVPDNVDARKAPRWRKISGARVARFHDHRIHWMDEKQPPAVRRAPGDRHVVFPDWQVAITDGTSTAVAHGDLVWVPGPSPVPMVLLAAVVCVGMLALGQLGSPFVPVALATAALVVIDIAHAFAVGFSKAGTTPVQIAQSLGSIVSIPAWIVGAGAVWVLLRRRVDGFFAAVFCGLIVAVVGGLSDFEVLSRSQIPFALPHEWARPIVAVSLGLGIGVAGASGLAIRRFEPSRPTDPA